MSAVVCGVFEQVFSTGESVAIVPLLRDGYAAVTLRLDGCVVYRDRDGFTVLGNVQRINGVVQSIPRRRFVP